ncbi:hypothetical protein ABPG74_013448 [Tetrahymena malaccensis]
MRNIRWLKEGIQELQQLTFTLYQIGRHNLSQIQLKYCIIFLIHLICIKFHHYKVLQSDLQSIQHRIQLDISQQLDQSSQLQFFKPLKTPNLIGILQNFKQGFLDPGYKIQSQQNQIYLKIRQKQDQVEGFKIQFSKKKKKVKAQVMAYFLPFSYKNQADLSIQFPYKVQTFFKQTAQTTQRQNNFFTRTQNEKYKSGKSSEPKEKDFQCVLLDRIYVNYSFMKIKTKVRTCFQNGKQ